MVRGGRAVAVVLFAVLIAGVALGAVAPAASAGDHPHVAITDPTAGSTVRGTVAVAGNAWDVDGEIVKVLVGIDARDRTLATDTSGNGTWWTWKWTWDTTFFENGWHHVVAIAYDNASLAGDTQIPVYVDNPADAPPNIEIRLPRDGAVVNGTVLIGGHAWDDVKIVLVKIQIDVDGPVYTAEDISGNGTWWVWRLFWNSRDVPNGVHVIYAKAVDDHEHVGWDSIHVKVMNEGGNTPPWVEIIQPKQGSTVCGIVVIKGHSGDHDVGDRVEKVQVKIDAGEWQLATDASADGSWSSWMFTWDATHADRTWHHVYARSFDGEAYSKVAVLEVLVMCDGHGENHRPEVRIDHPHSGEQVQGAVLVHGRAWDPDRDDKVTGVWVRIDEGEWHLAKDLTDNASWFIWGWVWDTTKYDNGVHRVCAKAFDGDLYSELSCIELKVENPDTRPKVHIGHPQDGDTVHGIVIVHGTASDDHGVKIVQVRIDEREWRNAIDLSSDHSWRTWAWEWDTRGFENGEHVISARSWDGHQYSEVHKIVVKVANDRGGIFSVFLENPVLTAVLGLGGTFAGSLALWRRRFGLLGSLR
jgi:hypothetical protein